MCISKSEILKSTLEMLEDEENYRNVEVELTFIAEHGKRIIDLIYFFQIKNEPTAHMVYNKLMAFRSEIIDGQTSVFFSAQIENLVFSLSVSNQNFANWIENFHASYKKICEKN